MRLLDEASKFIRQLGGGFTHLPTGFEYSPYIIVTLVSNVEDHNMYSIGSFVTHGLSPLPMRTTAESKQLALEAESLLLSHKPDITAHAGKGNFQALARSYRDLFGAMVIISVGGVPQDQANHYLCLMATLLHKDWILFQGEN